MDEIAPSFGTWLLDEIERREWTQAEFARRSKLKPQNVSRWISGERLPSYNSCLTIARVLGIDPDIVLGKAGHPLTRQVRERPRSLDDILRELEAQRPIAVPKVRHLASAGPGAPVIEEVEEYVYLPRRGGRRERLRAIEVTGDCMDPEICAGDTVVFDPEQMPTSGRVVVATVSEDGITRTLVKRFIQRRDGAYLEPRNGKPIKVDERVRIVGVVIHSGRDF